MSLQIHWRTPQALPEPERARCEERIERLNRERGDLIDVWIDVRESGHHRHGGDEISIRAMVRGAELTARREGADRETLMAETLAAFERELRDLRGRRDDRRHGALPTGSRPPHLGIVERVLADDGFGFILTDAGDRVYFHRNSLQGGLRLDALSEGQRVALNFEAGEEGLQATVVRAAPPDAPGP